MDFLQYHPLLQFKTIQQKRYVWDMIRQKHILVQPEELVRQLLILYLIHEKKYPANKIAIEVALQVNEQKKRCDVLVYDDYFKPRLLVECKAANVPLSQAVFDQIAQYNIPLQVPYLVVSNGVQTYCAKLDLAAQSFVFITQLPEFWELGY